MPENAKEVKQRLKTIKNTQKITKAMELVAAAKMRKAVESAVGTRNYHSLTWEIMERITKSASTDFRETNQTKRFFEPIENPNHVTLIVYSSNRGLCGSFNSNIIKLVLESINKYGKDKISCITVGNKATAILGRLGLKIDLAYKKDDSARSDESVIEIANWAYLKFKNKETDKVLAIYTDYKSAVTQNATTKQLFPFASLEKSAGLGESDIKKPQTLEAPKNLEYLYEPNKFYLLDFLVPRLAQVMLFQVLLESNASEHSARMVAMKNASEAAEDMGDDLLIEFNKARQASITKEIAEISAGRLALA